MDDNQFRQLLTSLNMSWKGYRKVRKGVKKRVSRHMQALACRKAEEYREKLRTDPVAFRECERRMTVPISRFFRDRDLWNHLQAFALPELVSAFPGPLRAWSAGCSGGEEPYSLKMIWNELAASRPAWPPLIIVASDLILEHLVRARRARYPGSSMKHVSEVRLERWAVRTGKGPLRLTDSLKDGILWTAHHLFAPPFRVGFHLILLRNNLLTYYEDPTRSLGFAAVLDLLHPGGLLIIGARERVPAKLLPALRETDHPLVYSRSPSS